MVPALDDTILELGVPPIRVVDVGWLTLAKYQGYIPTITSHLEGNSIVLRVAARGSVGSMREFRNTVASYGAAHAHDPWLLYLTAPTSDDWRDREAHLALTCRETTQRGHLCLSRAARDDPDLACDAIDHAIERLLRGGTAEACAVPPTAPAGAEILRNLVAESTGAQGGLALAVGGNEKQARARKDYPDRVMLEFGLHGLWLPTDYDHPDRVVSRVKVAHEAAARGDPAPMLVAVFSQHRNATNVKRDAMPWLKERGVLCSTPDFKSLGSCLHATKNALIDYVGRVVYETRCGGSDSTEERAV